MNREGVALLRQLIQVTAGMDALVQSGDCKSIAVMVNAWLCGAEVSPADVFAAIHERPDFGGPKMNVEILRARIDALPTLYSARLNSGLSGDAGAGALQAILNELVRETPEITIAEVRAAMALKRVPRPERTVSAAATLVGASALG